MNFTSQLGDAEKNLRHANMTQENQDKLIRILEAEETAWDDVIKSAVELFQMTTVMMRDLQIQNCCGRLKPKLRRRMRYIVPADTEWVCPLGILGVSGEIPDIEPTLSSLQYTTRYGSSEDPAVIDHALRRQMARKKQPSLPSAEKTWQQPVPSTSTREEPQKPASLTGASHRSDGRSTTSARSLGRISSPRRPAAATTSDTETVFCSPPQAHSTPTDLLTTTTPNVSTTPMFGDDDDVMM